MRTIIVPLDGSTLSEAALRPAFSVAQRIKATVVAVRVADDTDTAIESYLERRVHRFGDVAPYRVLAPRGDAASEITAVAAANPDSMIVMATHGRGGLGRMLLGSVAEAVLEASPGPVLLVGEHCRVVPLAGEQASLIVCTDGSARSDPALSAGVAFADALRLDIWLVEVMFGPDEDVPLDGGPPLTPLFDKANARVEDLGARLAAVGTAVQVRVLHGDPGRSLAHFASQLPAAFIVMAAHRRSESVRSGFGNVAANTVRHSPCPVLVVRAGSPSWV